MKRLIALACAALATAGCSQVAQLQPVAGGAVTAVRIGTNDVLVEKKVDIVEAPICVVVDDKNFRCTGKAANGPIESNARTLAAWGATKNKAGVDAPADVSLEVKVAGEVIFKGKLEDVITQNGQATS